jgi:hypothetical protein
MPIHVGIMCERCQKVHFITTSSAIQFSRSGGGIYRLNCPCTEWKDFRKEGIFAYRVADDIFRRGYAEKGEYEFVPSPERRTPRYLAAHG